MKIAELKVGHLEFSRNCAMVDLTDLYDWFISNMFILTHQNLILESLFNIMDIYGDVSLTHTKQEMVMQHHNWEHAPENDKRRSASNLTC